MSVTLDNFFNTSAERFGCCLVRSGNIVLSPVRYLCGGRHISYIPCTIPVTESDKTYYVKGAEITVNKSFEKPTNKVARWALNFFAALAFLPCAIVGGALKLAGHLNVFIALPLQKRNWKTLNALKKDISNDLNLNNLPQYVRTGENTVVLGTKVMMESFPLENRDAQYQSALEKSKLDTYQSNQLSGFKETLDSQTKKSLAAKLKDISPPQDSSKEAFKQALEAFREGLDPFLPDIVVKNEEQLQHVGSRMKDPTSTLPKVMINPSFEGSPVFDRPERLGSAIQMISNLWA